MEHLCHTTTRSPDQADSEILAPDVADEALEAAAGTERAGASFVMSCDCTRADCR